MTEILRPLLRAEDSVLKGSKSATTSTDPLTSLPTFDSFGWDVGLLEVAARKLTLELKEIYLANLATIEDTADFLPYHTHEFEIDPVNLATLEDTADFLSFPTHKFEIDPVNVATYKSTRTQEFIEDYYSTLGYKFEVDRVNLETLVGHAGGCYSSFLDTPDFDSVKLATDRLARIRETSSGNIASFYPHSSHGLGFYLYEGNTNYVFVFDPYKVTTYDFARSKEISLGNTAGYYPDPSYGFEAGLVEPARKVIFNYFRDHTSIPSHKLDAGLVERVTDAFASIQGTSYELDVGLDKPITNAFAWIKGGIDTIGKIVSPFHWAYKQASAIVGGKAIASEYSASFFVDPNHTVVSQLLAVINIGEDLVNKGIDNWVGVKTNPHEEFALVYSEVKA